MCGILSSLLYVATDVLGGLRYPGYRFTSQAISELGAIGAPTAPLVGPLFVLYDVLAMAFAVGVFWVAGGNRALRVTAILLVTRAVVGLAAATQSAFFAMEQRGAGSLATDAPHIILTGVIVLLFLLAMGFGAFALGSRFRIFTFAMMLVVIAFGFLTGRYAATLAAGQPTPGLGIFERINVYALMLWLAVLSVALLRRRSLRGAVLASKTTRVDGWVAPGFEEVRAEFERNFTERGDIGAAVAAYWRGEKVVDLWGGRRTPDGDEPWNRDTMVAVMSTTKGLSAMALAVANARGWLDYDAPVARYWPEFAQNGKARVTVRQLLAHEAGLVLLDEKLTLEKMRDLDALARILARQKPAWPPGTRHGYHTMTIGLCMQELVRRVDPAHRSLGQFFHEEIAVPLNAEFYIGLPPEIPGERIAGLKLLSRLRGLGALRTTPLPTLARILVPGTLLRRSMLLMDLNLNDRSGLEIELAAGNGVGTARAIARAYSAFAEGGAELGITPETLAQVTSPPPATGRIDVVLGVPSYFSLGFLRPGPDVWFGSSERTFGSPGAGGSFGFADPDKRLGYAYVMNKLDFYLQDDPREKALRDAVYRAIERLSARTKAGRSVSGWDRVNMVR
jgi:CubicO group peptidase (beta-lactamase class C family)/hypothetical membrane protein